MRSKKNRKQYKRSRRRRGVKNIKRKKNRVVGQLPDNKISVLNYIVGFKDTLKLQEKEIQTLEEEINIMRSNKSKNEVFSDLRIMSKLRLLVQKKKLLVQNEIKYDNLIKLFLKTLTEQEVQELRDFQDSELTLILMNNKSNHVYEVYTEILAEHDFTNNNVRNNFNRLLDPINNLAARLFNTKI